MALTPQKIKDIIQSNIGIPCSVISKQGRKTRHYKECIIEAAYPEIFCVKYIDSKSGKAKKMTFSYTDLFIKKVFICKRSSDSNKKMA